MSLTTVEPKVIINNKDIKYSSIRYNKTSINSVSTLDITTGDMSLKKTDLFNKEVTFFLNHGGKDNVPFFRGFVWKVIPSDKSVTVKTMDVLSLLTEGRCPRVKVDENNNFDGMTLSQFFHHFITKHINLNGKTFIGLDMLNETSPPKTLTNYRNDDFVTAMQIYSDNQVSDDAEIWNTGSADTSNLQWFLDVEDDGVKSNLVFKKTKTKDENEIRQACLFSFKNGLRSYTLKEDKAINTVTFTGDNTRTELNVDDFKNGKRTVNIELESNTSPDEARLEGFKFISNSNQDSKEISIVVNKGHYLPIGSIIRVKERHEPALNGYHSIVGKTLTLNKTKLNLSLQLNRPKPEFSDYI
tara:strand:+ start:825 stop:1892 length:1068 start_codon:yes stop_codon:yes gene_type:complete